LQIIYVATGSEYVKEALHSHSLLHSTSPSLNASIFVDTKSYSLFYTELAEHFSDVFSIDPSFSYRDKIIGIISALNKYDSILYLDTDTHVIKDISSLVNSSVDFAGCHAPVRIPDNCNLDEVPPFFPEVNSGVLYIKKSLVTQDLLTDWLEAYDTFMSEKFQSWDQLSLRSILWSYISKTKLKFLILPPEYNLRTTKPWFVGKGSFVYIVHGRFLQAELPQLSSYLNGNISRFRTWFEWKSINPKTSLKLQIPFDPFLS
jgi:hypothetical protein